MKYETIQFYLTTFRLAIIKKTKTANFYEAIENRKPLYTLGGNVNWYSLNRKHFIKKKFKLELSYDPVIPLLDIYQKRNGISILKRYLYCWPKSCLGFSVTFYGKIQMNFLTSPILCHAHYSIIYKSQDTETIYISVDGWMHKENDICT